MLVNLEKVIAVQNVINIVEAVEEEVSKLNKHAEIIFVRFICTHDMLINALLPLYVIL